MIDTNDDRVGRMLQHEPRRLSEPRSQFQDDPGVVPEIRLEEEFGEAPTLNTRRRI